MVRHFTDQLQRTISFNYPPRRIVSLVPSQTELLFDLGLEEQIVGITKFCVHPLDKVKAKTKVGGTKNFNLDAIRLLQPDLIVGNKEENYQTGIEALEKEFPVWMSDIVTLQDALGMIQSVGKLTDKSLEADLLVERIRNSFSSIERRATCSVLYLIWKSPWMAAGKLTFIDSMLSAVGLKNVVEETRYPELFDAKIQALNPEVVFLSSEPYPFKERHVTELKNLLPNSTIQLVDGEMFSWYGSRLVKAADYFDGLRFIS
ncbi:MAG: ABC transporter substrate-binding protein [Bacteroidetes bacterium]|nr:ABC transporter substrate-binding protein [Bacteroidota bacterium]